MDGAAGTPRRAHRDAPLRGDGGGLPRPVLRHGFARTCWDWASPSSVMALAGDAPCQCRFAPLLPTKPAPGSFCGRQKSPLGEAQDAGPSSPRRGRRPRRPARGVAWAAAYFGRIRTLPRPSIEAHHDAPVDPRQRKTAGRRGRRPLRTQPRPHRRGALRFASPLRSPARSERTDRRPVIANQ